MVGTISLIVFGTIFTFGEGKINGHEKIITNCKRSFAGFHNYL
ncbi:hypothetical protein FIC_01601 [Flavobacteriaceae bacterium 3519-10]|nr:hypothetical protein FIC_01601 [Flavobacteriaceae bacterium 3519-10]